MNIDNFYGIKCIQCVNDKLITQNRPRFDGKGTKRATDKLLNLF